MIRFIIIVLIVLLYLILGISVLLIEWVIGKINRRARDYSSLRLVQAAFKLIMFRHRRKAYGHRGRERSKGQGRPVRGQSQKLF